MMDVEYKKQFIFLITIPYYPLLITPSSNKDKIVCSVARSATISPNEEG